MATTINASTANGLIQTADTSGILELQANGVTQLTVTGAGAYGNLVRGVAQASTSGTAINFNDIPSWVRRITVMFNGVSTSGTSIVQLQLGDAGGVENTGYLCSSSNFTNTVLTASYTSGFGLRIADTAAQVIHGAIRFHNISGNIWVADGVIVRTDAAVTGIVAGSKTLSDILTQVRITTVNGTDTFDAGSINIMYEG